MLGKTKLVFLCFAATGLSGCLDTPSQPVASGQPVVADQCTVEYVYDGDTVSLDCPGRQLERARLVGFDTPEVFSPGCQAEKRLGDQATRRLRELVRNGTVTSVRRRGYDRYDRALVNLEINGTDVGRTLIGEGLALRYGGGRRIDWCQRLSA